MLSSSLPSTSEPEVLPLDVRGYTFRRKFAIVLWFLLFLIATATAWLFFALVDRGYEFSWHVHIQLLSNVMFGHRDLTFDIPLVKPARIIALGTSVLCGVKTLIKLFIPPPIRTHNVIIHHFQSEAKS